MDHGALNDQAYQALHSRKNGSTASAKSHRKRSIPTIDTRINRNLIHHTQITPPDTPNATTEGAAEDRHDMVFHNYLRAFYPFDPHSNLPGNDEAIRSAAALNAGDLILIHTIHANGWADGTVLTTGERGWLPTNYCEPYDHPYLRHLLNAMTQFWDLLGGSEGANLGTFIRQDYIRGLIAGVRHLLERADCLHRDATRVQRHTGVRRMRKGLLADLSTLVQIAKRLQETVSEPYADQTIHVLLDDLMTKAFKVVTRAVGFVDIWTQETSESRIRVESNASFESVTPPVDASPSAVSQPRSSVTLEQRVRSPSLEEGDVTVQGTNDPQKDVNQVRRTSWRPVHGSIKNRKGSVAHRLSHITVNSNRTTSSILASEQLAKVHDVCIGHIGAFIGHQLQSRRASGTAETTQKLIDACNNILTVIEQVRVHEAQGTVSVHEAQASLQDKLKELEASAQDAKANSDSEDPELGSPVDLSGEMVQLGTNLIRVAGEAVAKTRSLIEQVGDFELERPPYPPPPPTAEPTSPTSIAPSEPVSPATSRENRLSQKPLPPPPPPAVVTDSLPMVQTIDFGSPIRSIEGSVPPTPFSIMSNGSSLPISPIRQAQSLMLPSPNLTSEFVKPNRPLSEGPGTNVHNFSKDSLGLSISYSTDATPSVRDSEVTTNSDHSTRATTPDQTKENGSPNLALLNSFGSMSSFQSANVEADSETEMAESQLLQNTFASELTLNKEGQVSGGSLPALVEQLTTHDTAPDSRFVAAFFMTFRLFVTPCELTEALIARFDYIGDGKTVGMPVRLRICNVFKGWFETYWNAEADKDALDIIRTFATEKVRPVLQVAGDRLVDLVRRVTEAYENGTMTGPLITGMGRAGVPIFQQADPSSAPSPILSKSQLSGLRSGSHTTILDFDPLEIARQMTLMASKIYCDIQVNELLGLEWTKKDSPRAPNVRSLCNLNTDVVHVVGDSILAPDQAKQRAAVIKHWVKVAKHCLELHNYESLVAIMCSLNQSVIQRLKRTWQLVSKNTKDRLEELNAVTDISRNQASLRKHLEDAPVPCLPFLGLYLTDLTFVDAGNPKTRELPGSASETGEPVTVINFDKYMRTAKIINYLRQFQVPYQLQTVTDLQTWMEGHMERMRSSNEQMGTFHRRSLIIEPKMEDARARSYSVANVNRAPIEFSRNNSATSADEKLKIPPMPQSESVQVVREKFGHFLKHNAFAFKASNTAAVEATVAVDPQSPN